MKELFTHIQDTITDKVPAIRWVDFDLGQFETDPPPVSWPCVLVGFNETTWWDSGAYQQQGEVMFSLRVGFRLRERTHSKAADSFRDEALEHLDTVAAVHAALQGTSGATFEAIGRVGQASESVADYRIHRLTYRCSIREALPNPFQPAATGTVGFCIHPEMEE